MNEKNVNFKMNLKILNTMLALIIWDMLEVYDYQFLKM